MNDSVRRVFSWVPRILGLLFAAFISVFALDVFGAGYGVWETIAALLIHLIPTALILVALAVAWRWEWVGAVLFAGLGGWYIIEARGEPWIAYLLIAGPAFLTGGLFFVSWILRRQARSRAG